MQDGRVRLALRLNDYGRQLVCLRYRQRLHEHAIQETEDRDICADAEA